MFFSRPYPPDPGRSGSMIFARAAADVSSSVLVASPGTLQACRVRLNHEGKDPTRTRVSPTLSAAAAAACGVAFVVSSAGAQTTPPKCGVETRSAAENELRLDALHRASDEDRRRQAGLRRRGVVPGRDALRHATLHAEIGPLQAHTDLLLTRRAPNHTERRFRLVDEAAGCGPLRPAHGTCPNGDPRRVVRHDQATSRRILAPHARHEPCQRDRCAAATSAVR